MLACVQSRWTQLTVLVLLFPLLLEGDNDETHEDVHHEEGNDDDIDDEEDGDLHTVVVDGALVFCVGVNGAVQQLWPPFEGGDGEESHHGCQNIVKVKLAVLPASRLDNGVIDLSIFVCDIVTP